MTADPQMLQVILDADDEQVFALDTDGRYTAFNRAHAVEMRTLYGVEIHLGERQTDYAIAAADRKAALADHQRALAGERFVVNVSLGEAGRERSYQIVHSPHHDAAGGIVGVVIRAHDVTKRRQAESGLRESEQRFGQLFASMLEGFAYCRMVYDEAGRPDDFVYLAVNPAFERLTGLKDVAGRRVTDAIPGIREETPELFALYSRVVETGEDAELEIDFTPLGLWLHISVFRPEPGHFVAVFTDVGESRRLESELDAERLRYKLLVENSSEAILLTTPEGDVLAANPEACRMFGRSEQEIRALGRAGLVDVTDQRLAAGLKERAQTGSASGELRFLRSDGTKFPAEVSTRVYTDPSGQDRTSMVIRDLTERVAAEAALLESEERYRSVVERASDAVVIGRDGRVLFANEAFSRLLGYRDDELDGLDLFSVFKPEDRDGIADRARRRSAGTASPSAYDAELMAKDGTIRTVELRANALTYQGEPALVAVIRDVTERRRSEAALRESEELYRSILRASPDDITVTDLEGRILVVSPAALSMLGYRREDEMLGRSMAEFLGPDDRERAAANVGLMFQGVFTGPGEYLAIRADGSTFPIEANAELIRDADERPTGMVFVARDITKRKRSEDEIRRLNAELEARVVSRTEQRDAAARELESFAYSVAHDVRTPLRAIDGFSAMVLDDEGQTLSASLDRASDASARGCAAHGAPARRLARTLTRLAPRPGAIPGRPECTGVRNRGGASGTAPGTLRRAGRC